MAEPPRIDQLLHPPEKGVAYLVPTLEYTLSGRFSCWPVHGREHDDGPYRRGLQRGWHMHVDTRFLTDDQAAWVNHANLRDGGGGARTGTTGLYQNSIDGPFQEPVWRPLTCTWSGFDQFPEHKRTLPFKQAYEGRKCPRVDGQLLCPHEGYPLGSVRPYLNEVICPLHHLRIDLRTERVGKPFYIEAPGVQQPVMKRPLVPVMFDAEGNLLNADELPPSLVRAIRERRDAPNVYAPYEGERKGSP